MKNIKNKKTGFTLVELLVVIAIIGILTIISLSSFVNAQRKSRDAQRKSDLDNLSKALMLYYADKGVFPDKNAVVFGDDTTGLVDPTAPTTIYMRKIPEETQDGMAPYVYEVGASNTTFNLFADLENRNDSQCQQDSSNVGIWNVSGNDYCYGVSSPNAIVDPSQF